MSSADPAKVDESTVLDIATCNDSYEIISLPGAVPKEDDEQELAIVTEHDPFVAINFLKRNLNQFTLIYLALERYNV